MFEELFKDKSTIRRHQLGPLAKERRRYLAFKAEEGAARSTLCATASYVLAVANHMALANRAAVPIEAVEAAANSWAQSPRKRNPKATFRGRRRAFKAVACSWLGFLGRLRLPPREPQPYKELAEQFAVYIAKERGFSHRTIAGYCWYIKDFLTQVVAQGATIRRLDVKVVDNVLLSLGRKGYTRRGIQTYARAVRSFLRYGEERGWCTAGTASALVTPRAFRQEGLPSGPSWPEVRRLLASTATRNPKDIRDRAILLLLAVYGFRVEEVRRLQLEDIDWEQEVISIRTSKQRRTRVYPLSRSVGDAILRYLREVRPRTKDRTVFLRMKSPLRSLSVGGLWSVVGRRVRQLGIVVQHPGPHCLRHACAARLLAQGFSLKEIGDQLGHRSPESTQIYAKVDLASLREVSDFDLGGLV